MTRASISKTDFTTLLPSDLELSSQLHQQQLNHTKTLFTSVESGEPILTDYGTGGGGQFHFPPPPVELQISPSKDRNINAILRKYTREVSNEQPRGYKNLNGAHPQLAWSYDDDMDMSVDELIRRKAQNLQKQQQIKQRKEDDFRESILKGTFQPRQSQQSSSYNTSNQQQYSSSSQYSSIHPYAQDQTIDAISRLRNYSQPRCEIESSPERAQLDMLRSQLHESDMMLAAVIEEDEDGRVRNRSRRKTGQQSTIKKKTLKQIKQRRNKSKSQQKMDQQDKDGINSDSNKDKDQQNTHSDDNDSNNSNNSESSEQNSLEEEEQKLTELEELLDQEEQESSFNGVGKSLSPERLVPKAPMYKIGEPLKISDVSAQILQRVMQETRSGVMAPIV
ncbi:MAG: hypothetical protein EZS28_037406, partial [Streblomastix strix]